MGIELVAWGTQLSTPRMRVFGSTHPIIANSGWTVPMSHYEYNEWCDKTDIGIHSLQWSPQADF